MKKKRIFLYLNYYKMTYQNNRIEYQIFTKRHARLNGQLLASELIIFSVNCNELTAAFCYHKKHIDNIFSKYENILLQYVYLPPS